MVSLPFDEIGFVMGLVQLIKPFVPEEHKGKVLPLCAVVVGILLSLAISYGAGQLAVQSVIDGMLYGLAAAGFYSGVKAATRKE